MKYNLNLQSVVNTTHSLGVNTGEVCYVIDQIQELKELRSLMSVFTDLIRTHGAIFKEKLNEKFLKLGVEGALREMFEVHIEAVPTRITAPLKGTIKRTKLCDDFILAFGA